MARLFNLLIPLSISLLAAVPAVAGDFRAVLESNCFKCHGAKKQRGELRADSLGGLLAGGESGPAIVPGHPERSRLVHAIRYEDVDFQMPPRKKLADEDIATLVEWIRAGAEWPGSSGEIARAETGSGFDLEGRKAAHWAWDPIRDRTIASIDSFFDPAPFADRPTLARRLFFDLTGLPPDPARLDAFLADERPDAWSRLVDELLASPRFGERWGRHWLDLVRYSESLGHEFDYTVPHAWRYRDYVIRALNADVPYDVFAREHIAGDLVRPPRVDPVSGANESVIGTASYWFGQQKHSPVDLMVEEGDRIDNQIDVVSKTFLGLTVACSRCHDHKFDAIPTSDYYALVGILQSSRYAQVDIDPDSRTARQREELSELRREALALVGVGEGEREETSSGAPLPDDAIDISPSRVDGWTEHGRAFAPGGAGLVLDPIAKTARTFSSEWRHSGALSRRLEGELRSPSFRIERRYLLVEACGRDSRINIVIDGFTLIRAPIYGGLKQLVNDDNPRWYTFDLAMWQGHRAYVELVDQSVPDLADSVRANGYGRDGYFATRRIYLSDSRSAPAPGPIESHDPTRFEAHFARAAAIAETIPAPTCVPALIEGSGRDSRVRIRGKADLPGEVAPRRFLTAIAGPEQPPVERGSGRLEFAERMLDRDDPFFARVIVNRIWHHLFGRGIVPSVDNFGVLGQPPSQPELLDWLAARFVEDGYSIKRAIRRLVLTETYRSSGSGVRRLQGEVIRDAILALSGRLDLAIGGEPVPVHLTPFVDGRGRPRSGPIDGAGRRSIYLSVRRNFLSPFMLAFDMPNPATTVGRRSSSNVPAQALSLLNDRLVIDQARRWAERVVSAENDADARVRRMYREAISRPPRASELAAAREFIARQAKEYRTGESDIRPWIDLAHVLFNVKEFFFVR